MIYGADIGAKEIILHNGSQSLRISTPLEAQALIKPNDVVILEQTGAYGIRWAEIFTTLGAKVFIADGRDFKNYRLAHSRKKDDTLDAFYLRKYYQEKPHKCRPYNPMQVHTRALIRQHIRNNKDITKHTNRLKQYLAMIYPAEDIHLWSREKLHNRLKHIEERLKQTPHALTDLALAEVKKLKICLEEAQKLEEELINIARNHPDYEILKTFPMGDIEIATLLAYSWDIQSFTDKKAYIGYVLMGSTLEQSGSSIYKVKVDKARTEIKGIFYMLFMRSHRKNDPLYPLARLSKELINTKHNFKKRYIKFLSRFIELTYEARKHRTDYLTTLQNRLSRLKEELSHTKRKDLTEYRAMKLYRLTRSIKTIEELIAQRKDICFPLKDGEGTAPSLFGLAVINLTNQKEENHEEDQPLHSHSQPDDSYASHSQPEPASKPATTPDGHGRGNTLSSRMHKREVENNKSKKRRGHKGNTG